MCTHTAGASTCVEAAEESLARLERVLSSYEDSNASNASSKLSSQEVSREKSPSLGAGQESKASNASGKVAVEGLPGTGDGCNGQWDPEGGHDSHFARFTGATGPPGRTSTSFTGRGGAGSDPF